MIEKSPAQVGSYRKPTIRDNRQCSLHHPRSTPWYTGEKQNSLLPFAQLSQVILSVDPFIPSADTEKGGILLGPEITSITNVLFTWNIEKLYKWVLFMGC